jgi:hypothetical protein
MAVAADTVAYSWPSAACTKSLNETDGVPRTEALGDFLNIAQAIVGAASQFPVGGRKRVHRLAERGVGLAAQAPLSIGTGEKCIEPGLGASRDGLEHEPVDEVLIEAKSIGRESRARRRVEVTGSLVDRVSGGSSWPNSSRTIAASAGPALDCQTSGRRWAVGSLVVDAGRSPRRAE